MNRRNLYLVCLLLATIGCSRQPAPQEGQRPLELGSRHVSEVISQMTDIMVHDVTNPPLAARFFAYACLAGYEVVAQNDSSYTPMHGVLNQYPALQKPAGITGYSPDLSALLAMVATARKMQPSGPLLEQYQQHLLDSCRREGVQEEVITQSLAYAQHVSQEILAYAKADLYNRISNYPRYTPKGEEGTWYPTPPGFFAPVEPYFNKIRPFTLDTCTQFLSSRFPALGRAP